MYSPSFSGRPVDAGVTSMIGSPSRLSDPIDARESVVTRDCISSRIDSRTSTAGPANPTFVTFPTSTPATRTIAPLLRPCTLSNFVLSS